jgi:class 3 adenylate cyclase
VHAAARIGAAAEGQEILASKDTLAKLDQFKTGNDREIALKGFKHDVPVCSVEWNA